MTSIHIVPALLLVGTLVACGSAADVETSTGASDEALKTAKCDQRGEPIVTMAKGTWTVGPLTIISEDPTTGAASASGGDVFTGTFTGTSTYIISGTFAADGSFTGYSDETITAKAPDGTSGTITEAHQPLHIDPNGNFFETSPITSGTGDWAGSTGLLFYTGWTDITDPSGDAPGQGGTYEGIWIRPAPTEKK